MTGWQCNQALEAIFSDPLTRGGSVTLFEGQLSRTALQRGGASRMLAPPPNSSPRGGSRAPPGFAGMDPYLLKAFML